MKKLDLPDFSKLTLEKEKRERQKLNDRIKKAKKDNELNLLVMYTYYLYNTGYLLMLPSMVEIKNYLSETEKYLEGKGVIKYLEVKFTN